MYFSKMKPFDGTGTWSRLKSGLSDLVKLYNAPPSKRWPRSCLAMLCKLRMASCISWMLWFGEQGGSSSALKCLSGASIIL